MKQRYTIEYKIRKARSAIINRDRGGTIIAIADLSGLSRNMLHRWVREYESGKLVQEQKRQNPRDENLRTLKSIDRSLKKIIGLLSPAEVPAELMGLLEEWGNGESQSENSP